AGPPSAALMPPRMRPGKGKWCGREDSNFHGLSATATSTLRVYQFRHDRTCCTGERLRPVGSGPLAVDSQRGNSPATIVIASDAKQSSGGWIAASLRSSL